MERMNAEIIDMLRDVGEDLLTSIPLCPYF